VEPQVVTSDAQIEIIIVKLENDGL